ncbi:hypothetical protein QR680_017153 [Steinernema hermaphroditum]|uniref:Beta-lactamase-like protein 2 homolog n=1 Tax=Steinernema hermaphroditum TaxID=289476 RepID=A0AA39HFW9_9BILA|nr:hypothetical protein QR680_017153 [Steinernema hermaphroditum]
MPTWRNYVDYSLGAAAYLFNRYLSKSMPPSLTPIDPITKLSPRVDRILGMNPGAFTLQGTNTYLVGTGKSRILIDTGDANVEKYIQNLGSVLGEHSIEGIVITHWHHDHVGGIPNVLQKLCGGKNVPIYKIRRTDGTDSAVDYTYIDDGHEIKTEGATLKLLATPGHTVDHIVVYFEEENSIFSGDCILGESTSVFEDLYSYMRSLDKLLKIQPSRIYPGHGPVIEEPVAKITEYIQHRMKRENEIVKALGELKEGSSMDITKIVYKDINMAVLLAAASNVKHHLSKLMKEERVTLVSPDWYKLC